MLLLLTKRQLKLRKLASIPRLRGIHSHLSLHDCPIRAEVAVVRLSVDLADTKEQEGLGGRYSILAELISRRLYRVNE